MSDRVPPHDTESERSVLAAILLDAAALLPVMAVLTAEDFYHARHRWIFEAMLRLYKRGVSVDFAPLRDELTTMKRLEEIGPAAITALVDGVPRFSNVEASARVVKANAVRRKTISVAGKIAEMAYDGADVADLVCMATASVQTLVGSADDDDGLPVVETLDVMLAEPDEAVEWRIKDLQPATSRVMLAAQFKSGKTTLVTNLVRSLADGDPFLGAFGVDQSDGLITVIDLEMSQRQSKKWYRLAGIRRPDRVWVVCLRGRVGTFNILDDRVRRRWARRLRQQRTSYLVIDCLRPILDALGLDEHKDTGRLLVAIDALLAEAGIPDAAVVHHMGHNGERSRGDSRLRDWPDVEWTLVRKTEDAASARFLKAYGRDVDVPEGQLAYDAATRRLALLGGSRKDADYAEVLADINAVLKTKGQALSGRSLKDELADNHPRNLIDEALKHARETNTITFSNGPRSSILYHFSPERPECPRVSQEHTDRVSRRLYKAGHSDTHLNQSSVPKGQANADRF